MPLVIANLSSDSLPIDLAGVTPDAVGESPLVEIQRRNVLCGNREAELGELFRISGDAADMTWRLEGDFSAVHGLAAGMNEGEIVVKGPIGRHAGAGMKGGRLEICGDAGDWLGAEMQGGVIHVHGSAGDSAGAAYRGGRRGMADGAIFIDGDAGEQTGELMRRGLIVVGGNVGDWLGMRMLAGTILVFGGCSEHPGAGMRRGTIGLLGSRRPELSPTFRRACRTSSPVMQLLAAQVRRELLPETVEVTALSQPMEIFHGDFLEGGRGEILMPA